jgi:hypothetical protein
MNTRGQLAYRPVHGTEANVTRLQALRLWRGLHVEGSRFQGLAMRPSPVRSDGYEVLVWDRERMTPPVWVGHRAQLPPDASRLLGGGGREG